MTQNNTNPTLARWTPELILAFRKLWFAWYPVDRIALLLGVSQQGVRRQASKLRFPYRPPEELRRQFVPVPALEAGLRPVFYPPSTFVVPKYLRLQPRQVTIRVTVVINLPGPTKARVPPGTGRGKPLRVVTQQEARPTQPQVLGAPPIRRPPGYYKPAKGRLFDDAEDQAAIEAFMRTKGVTKCEPVFLTPTQTDLRPSEEQHRLTRVAPPQHKTRQQLLDERKQASNKTARWMMFIKKVKAERAQSRP